MKTILFVDIDGVLSIPTEENASHYEKFGYGLPAWPIPLAYKLIQAINQDKRFKPIWLSSWDTASHTWNDKANTSHWPIGYCLTNRQSAHARKVLSPDLFTTKDGKYIDRKLIAAQYYLRHYPSTHPVTWIEDGFAEETEVWAKQRGNIQLIDTTLDPALSWLLANEESAIHRLIDMMLCK